MEMIEDQDLIIKLFYSTDVATFYAEATNQSDDSVRHLISTPTLRGLFFWLDVHVYICQLV